MSVEFASRTAASASVRYLKLAVMLAATLAFLVLGAHRASAASAYPPSTPSSSPTVVTQGTESTQIVTKPASSLASTGSDVVLAAEIGGSLLVAGAVVTVVARRRSAQH